MSISGTEASCLKHSRLAKSMSTGNGTAAKWDSSYNFPAVQSKAVVKSEIFHRRPSGIRGFVFNTRREKFKDIEVRDALIHAFNYELTNAIMNDGKLPRIQSYFSNSVLGARPGPAEGKVLELLLPYENELPEDAIRGYKPPVSDGSERNRKNIVLARDLFQSAGWSIDADGILKDAEGTPFEIEILVVQGAHDTMSIAEIYVESLKRLGIKAEITLVDSSQYKERTNAYDFDMAWYRRSMSLSPGNEQRLYWGHEGVDTPGNSQLDGGGERCRRSHDCRDSGSEGTGRLHCRRSRPRQNSNRQPLRYPGLVFELFAAGSQGGAKVSGNHSDLRRLDRLSSRRVVA